MPLPFAEVDAGTAFAAGEVAFGGAAGLGLSVPLVPNVLIDVVGRDWLVTVGPGQVGVVWTPGGTRADALPEGVWGIGVFDRATTYDARSQEREERLSVLASNGLQIVLDASVRYHIVSADAVKLDGELGIRYYEILLGPTLRSQARRVVGRYLPEEIYSSQRELIERQIREGVEKAIEGRHLALEAVLIRNVVLPETIQQAINDKLQAEQQALKMKFVLEQAEAEAQKRLIEQKAEADRSHIAAVAHAETDRIDAEAHAESMRINAAATADYERQIGQHLTDAVLRWQAIKALHGLAASPNSKLVFLGRGATGTLLDLKELAP
ncbi:MAG TPA: prohibitin family protein [Polyangiaceae bacterium]|nr:prohibitin family protein [Polyangiaceae bacterium]